jgi:hypothetical protein
VRSILLFWSLSCGGWTDGAVIIVGVPAGFYGHNGDLGMVVSNGGDLHGWNVEA